MKTINESKKWSVGLKAASTENANANRPRIGDDDGVSDRTMNIIILVFMLLTMGISVAAAAQTDETKYRILLRQAMLDMDRTDYDKAIPKLLEVRANTQENANVDHMLGLCYLYTEDGMEKAVFYLNRAAQNVSADHEEWDLDETRAPIETTYHLAKAYEGIGDFAMAAQFYGEFVMQIGGSPLKVSAKTLALISRSADRCRLAAAEQANAEQERNMVFNK